MQALSRYSDSQWYWMSECNGHNRIFVYPHCLSWMEKSFSLQAERKKSVGLWLAIVTEKKAITIQYATRKTLEKDAFS